MLPMCIPQQSAFGFRFALCVALLGGVGLSAEETIHVEEAQVSLIQNAFVAAPIAGVVAEVTVSEGNQVTIDDLLAKLDDQQAKTELEAAQAAYDAARLESDNDVDARYAVRTLEVRQRELDQSLETNEGVPGAVSETEIEKQRLVIDQARLAIEQAQHQQNVARARAIEKRAAVQIAAAKVEKHSIHTTVSGKVVEVAIEPGEWVDAGKPIVRVISLDPIRVECFVDGRKYGPELEGRKIEFFPNSPSQIDGKSQKLTGIVEFVSPELNPITGEARLRAAVKNPLRRLRSGMKGRLVILPQ